MEQITQFVLEHWWKFVLGGFGSLLLIFLVIFFFRGINERWIKGKIIR